MLRLHFLILEGISSVPYADLNFSERILMGPGPSTADPRVLRAMTTPVLGYLDPDYLRVMQDVKELLRYGFQTQNGATFPVQGTGFSGMDACLGSLIEPDDKVLVAVNGFFGGRMGEMAERYGARVVRLEQDWGKAFPLEVIEGALKKHPDAKLFAIVHGETSTGVRQPLEGVGRLCRKHGPLLLVDAVTSLGGCPLYVDAWEIDVCYSGSQKCLGCPPGMAPVTLSERALGVMAERRRKVPSYYLDLSLIKEYWGEKPIYHHTGPVSMVYGLREALRILSEEGLEARWRRHAQNASALQAGLEALGLDLFAERDSRLPSLTTVRLKEGMEDAALRGRLRKEFNVEVGGGLGAFAGRIWRIGLMGYTSTRRNVIYFLSALESLFQDLGILKEAGQGLAAAQRVYLDHQGG